MKSIIDTALRAADTRKWEILVGSLEELGREA